MSRNFLPNMVIYLLTSTKSYGIFAIDHQIWWKRKEANTRVLRNLQAEMTRSGVSVGAVSKSIGKSDRKVRDTLAGRYQFGVYEAFKIRDTFFPGLTMEYLFARDEGGDT